jgi:hypothetical protein
MQKEFIPYEQALELKELGYNQSDYLNWYNLKGELQWDSEYSESEFSKKCCSAPLYQQAFRWFRDKHNIDAWVQPFMMEKHGTPFLPDESYVYWIFKDGVLIADGVDFLNPEEAELACLKKLIEIVKEK